MRVQDARVPVHVWGQADSGNRLLQVRGNAGTHDLGLGSRTLAALKGANAGGGAEVAVPRYDKSCHGGRGDRAAESAWPVVKGPLDIVLFEGWMLGFSPIPTEAVEKVPHCHHAAAQFFARPQTLLTIVG